MYFELITVIIHELIMSELFNVHVFVYERSYLW